MAKTTIELAVFIHFDREIDDTRSIRDNVAVAISDLISSEELTGPADKEALVDEFNVCTTEITLD
jgi:hypothetical protein